MADTPFPRRGTGDRQVDNENALYEGAAYKPILSNWFTAKPYGFRFTPRTGTKDAKVMYLPIGPSNLTITTHFATNLIPTIYGTVEEHSPVRYYDITIEGTTGMAPKYIEPLSPNESVTIPPGRSSFSVQTNLSTIAEGLFAKTLAATDKIYNDVASFVAAPAKTGIQLDQTGYIAFHNLYRFFLKYKQDVSGTEKNGNTVDTSAHEHQEPPLVFFNYKDNNEYSVMIKSFVLRRDKENPMLYYYSISLHGHDLKSIETSDGVNKIKGQNKLLQELGLNGIKGSTFLSSIKEKASTGRDVLTSVANGINLFWR